MPVQRTAASFWLPGRLSRSSTCRNQEPCTLESPSHPGPENHPTAVEPILAEWREEAVKRHLQGVLTYHPPPFRDASGAEIIDLN